nr:GntR family transcriptional regulator [Pseudonocardia sp. AL041005-10]
MEHGKDPMTTPTKTTGSQGEQAYHALRTRIVSCEVTPGTTLSERRLAAETGFGLASIRNALIRLDHEGLVETLPRRGYRVTPLTVRDVDDLMEVWSIVGPELLRLGLTRADPAQRRRIVAGFAQIQRAAHLPTGPETAARIIDESEKTFALVANAAGNLRLAALLQDLSGDLGRVWTLAFNADPGLARFEPEEFWAPSRAWDNDHSAVVDHSRHLIGVVATRIRDLVRQLPEVADTELRAPHTSAHHSC